jgi:C4-dicarboxylate-specific signal transduction histidine kinase
VEVLEEKQVISPVRVSTRKPGSGRSGGGKLRGASTRAGSLRNRHPLQQVLLNLILNGMEAMSESSKSNRRLTVRTAYDGKGNVEVAVEDSGPGIPPDRLPRLFDSFFTTKLHGMGLGLSIVGRSWKLTADESGQKITLAAERASDSRCL